MRFYVLSLVVFLILLGSDYARRGEQDTLPVKVALLQGQDYDPEGGADSYAGRGDNPASAYYRHPDYYNLRSNDTLLILPRFRTMQQTTEWSCGNVAALLVLRHFGVCPEATEWSLAKTMRSMTDRSKPGCQPGSACRYEDFGTSLRELYHYFKGLDSLQVVATSYREHYGAEDLVKEGDLFPRCDQGNLYPSFSSPKEFSGWLREHLRANRPVLVEWSDWDGHWVCIIGFDNNGTPDFCGDDTLILADPYDTSDHWQDGYAITPLERFFYLWKDRAIAPKPYQLQPFLVVDRVGR
ncbi:hypothetical protein [Parabacteroides sp.]